MLPKTNDGPTFGTKHSLNSTVTRYVSIDLFLPKLSVAAWNRPVLWTAVPEATINEYCELLFGKGEDRSTGDRIVPSPARNAICAEQLSKRDFRAFVPLPAYAGHDI